MADGIVVTEDEDPSESPRLGARRASRRPSVDSTGGADPQKYLLRNAPVYSTSREMERQVQHFISLSQERLDEMQATIANLVRMKLKEKQKEARKVIREWSTRHRETAFGGWKGLVVERKKTLQRASAFFGDGLVLRYFQGWCGYLRAWRQQLQTVKQAIARRLHGLVAVVFVGWRDRVRNQLADRELMLRQAESKWCSGLVGVVFEALVEYTKMMRAARRKGSRVLARVSHGVFATCVPTRAPRPHTATHFARPSAPPRSPPHPKARRGKQHLPPTLTIGASLHGLTTSRPSESGGSWCCDGTARCWRTGRSTRSSRRGTRSRRRRRKGGEAAWARRWTSAATESR